MSNIQSKTESGNVQKLEEKTKHVKYRHKRHKIDKNQSSGDEKYNI